MVAICDGETCTEFATWHVINPKTGQSYGHSCRTHLAIVVDNLNVDEILVRAMETP